jgi:hypothetical protein
MKMVKPTQRDIDRALQLAAYITALRDGDRLLPATGKQPGDVDYWQDESTAFDDVSGDDCSKALNQILALAGSSAWLIPMAFATVASPANAIIDPDSDTLELHSRIVAALSAVDTVAS